jgi:hypothetical protein
LVNIAEFCIWNILKRILIIWIISKFNIFSKTCIETINNRSQHTDNHHKDIPNKQQFIVFADNNRLFEILITCFFSQLAF